MIVLKLSRRKWIPFAAVSNVDAEDRMATELPLITISFTVSLVLLGWRQRWWLAAPAVDAKEQYGAECELRAVLDGLCFASCSFY